MDPKDKNKFKEIVCQILKIVLNDELIKDHLKLCKELAGIPVYKQSEQTKTSSVSSKMSSKSAQKDLNEIALKQAAKDENKMVNNAALY